MFIRSFSLLFTFLIAFEPSANTSVPNAITYDDALKQANALMAQMNSDDTHQMGLINATSQSPLSLNQIQNNPDIWPASVLMTEIVDFSGGLTLNKGDQLTFIGFDKSGELQLDYGEYQLTLPAEFTNFVKMANDIADGTAKENGFKGRLIEQLAPHVYVKYGDQLRRASVDDIKGADFYLFYHSSKTCRWSGRFTPSLIETVSTLDSQHPGKILVIYVSADRNMGELQSQFSMVGADATMPPMPKWYIDTFSNFHPKVQQINQPSFMLMNSNGRLLDSGMRRNDDYSDLFQALDSLPDKVQNSQLYTPAWSQPSNFIAPNQSNMPSIENGDDKQQMEADIGRKTDGLTDGLVATKQMSTDPSVIGPVPFNTIQNGIEIPGLMLFDKLSTGNRIPAITLQAFPDSETEQAYYVLSFRQVLNQNTSSRPLLISWMRSVSSRGAQAQADLLASVEEFKQVHAKYKDWRTTAINNQVSNFEKEMYTMPNTVFHHPATSASFTFPGDNRSKANSLVVNFKVFDDPKKAFIKGKGWSLSTANMNAFERLIPQIDTLTSQIQAAVISHAEQQKAKHKKAKETDSLFN